MQQRNALESRVQAINFDEFHRRACARLRPKAAQYGSRFEAVARDPATHLRIGAIGAGETPRRCARLRIRDLPLNVHFGEITSIRNSARRVRQRRPEILVEKLVIRITGNRS